MQPPDAADDLIVSTPERVAFQYEIAGIGSRFLAQFIDVLIITVIQIVITIGAGALGGIFNSIQVFGLVEVILTFILITGYFLISEAAWNGQTLGKRYVRLRVVGDQGEPLTIGQAAIRNLIRVVDFLPAFYAIGIIAMFSNRRSKRLGDFAAGTLVVRDRERIRLYDLPSTAPAPTSAPPPTSSICTISRRFLFSRYSATLGGTATSTRTTGSRVDATCTMRMISIAIVSGVLTWALPLQYGQSM